MIHAILEQGTSFFTNILVMKKETLLHRIPIDLIILFLVSLTPLFWFTGNAFITGFDSGYPLDSVVNFIDRLFLWTNRFGFGQDTSMSVGGIFLHGQEALTAALGLSPQMQQKVIFVSWFFMIGFAQYIFARTISDKKLRLFPLIAALFLMFNSFTLQAWPVIERTRFSMIIATTLVGSLVFRMLVKKMSIVRASILSALTLFVFNADGSEGLPLYAGMMIFITIFGLGVWYVNSDENEPLIKGAKRLITFAASTAAALFLLDAYWIIPFWQFTHTIFDAIGSISVDGPINWLRSVSVSASLLHLFQLQGEPGWYEKGTSHPFGPFFLTNPLLVLGSFLWVPLALCGVILSNDKIKKYAIIFLGILLVGMFFAAGSHPPTGTLFEFFFVHVPGFLILRSAWFKFNYLISISTALLIGLGIEMILARVPKRIGYAGLVCFIVILGFYNFPYFQRHMFDWNRPLSLLVSVPPYVNDFDQWAKVQPQSDKFLVLPPLNAQWDGIAYQWGYYSFGNPPTSLLMQQTNFTNNTSITSSENIILSQIYQSLRDHNEQKTEQLLHLLGVTHVIVQRDVERKLAWIPAEDPAIFTNAIEHMKMFSKVKTFGMWDIYSLHDGITTSQAQIIATSVDTSSALSLVTSGTQGATMTIDPKGDHLPFEANEAISAECITCNLPHLELKLPTVNVFKRIFSSPWFVKRDLNKQTQTAQSLSGSEKLNYLLGNSLKNTAFLLSIDRSKDSQSYQLVFEAIKKDLDQVAAISQANPSPYNTTYALHVLSFLSDIFINIDMGDQTSKDLLVGLANHMQSLYQQVGYVQMWGQQDYQLSVISGDMYRISTPLSDKNILSLSLDGKEFDPTKPLYLSAGMHTVHATFPTELTEMEQTPGKTIWQTPMLSPEMSYRLHIVYTLSPDTSGYVRIVPTVSSEDGIREILPVLDGQSHDFDIIFSPKQKPTAYSVIVEHAMSVSNVTLEQEPLQNSFLFVTTRALAPQPIIPLSKLNNTYYVTRLTKPMSGLVYLPDTYYPSWKLFVDEKPVPERRHFQANSFANAWYIDQSDYQDWAPHTISLVFMPQVGFVIGAGISILTLIGCLIILWRTRTYEKS